MRGRLQCQVIDWLVLKHLDLIIKITILKISGVFTVALSFFAGQHSDGQNIIFSDGEYINQIAACKDVS